MSTETNGQPSSATTTGDTSTDTTRAQSGQSSPPIEAKVKPISKSSSPVGPSADPKRGRSRQRRRSSGRFTAGLCRHRCSRPECGHSYTTRRRLNEHELNHRCGYGIDDGSRMTNECRNECIARYRRDVRTGPSGGGQWYACAYGTGCDFKTRSRSSIKDHIHARHVCPHRQWDRVVGGGHTSMTDTGAAAAAVAAGQTPTQPLVVPLVVKVENGQTSDALAMNGLLPRRSGLRSESAANRFNRCSGRLRANPKPCAAGGQTPPSTPTVPAMKRSIRRQYTSLVRKPAIRTSGQSLKESAADDDDTKPVFETVKISDRHIHRHQTVSRLSDPNYIGLQSLKTVDKLYVIRVVDGQKWYACQYMPWCRFQSKATQCIARHINCVHIKSRRFRCQRGDCRRVYWDPNALRRHELNHECGYGMGNGRTMTGPCGNRSINRYRKRAIVDNKRYYRCDYNDCRFQTASHCSIKEHIHSQHLCPKRVRVVERPVVVRELAPECPLIAATVATPIANGHNAAAIGDNGSDIKAEPDIHEPVADDSDKSDGQAIQFVAQCGEEVKSDNNDHSVHSDVSAKVTKDMEIDSRYVTRDVDAIAGETLAVKSDTEVIAEEMASKFVPIVSEEPPTIEMDIGLEPALETGEESVASDGNDGHNESGEPISYPCGYGVRAAAEWHRTDPCGDQSIGQYMRTFSEPNTGRTFCYCIHNDCFSYWSYSLSALKTHIHDLHVCPHRVDTTRAEATDPCPPVATQL